MLIGHQVMDVILIAVLTNQNAHKFVRIYVSRHEKGLNNLDHSKVYRQFITKGSKLAYELLTYRSNLHYKPSNFQ